MSETSGTTEITATGTIRPPVPRAKRILHAVSWSFLGVFFLILFTLLKLPEERLKNYVQGSISAALAPKGISLTAGSSHLGFLLGPSYTLSDVTLNFPPPDAPAHIDRIEVAPALLPLLIGRLGGKVRLRNGDGRASAAFSTKGSRISISFDAEKLDLGKLGLLPALAGVKATAVVDGEASFSGDMSEPRNDSGSADLSLTRILLEPQKIQGFDIPRISISEGKLQASIDAGKITIKSLKLGKSDADDIHGNLKGDLTLARMMDASLINLSATVGFSDAFTHAFSSFSLLESLVLSPTAPFVAKLPDGSWSFTLTGTFGAPISTPAPGGH